jgi:phage terminase large subunit GpA-like protein
MRSWQRGAFFLTSPMLSEPNETQTKTQAVICTACRSVAIVMHQEPLCNSVRVHGYETRQLRTGTRFRIFCPQCGGRTQVEFDDERKACEQANDNAADN